MLDPYKHLALYLPLSHSTNKFKKMKESLRQKCQAVYLFCLTVHLFSFPTYFFYCQISYSRFLLIELGSLGFLKKFQRRFIYISYTFWRKKQSQTIYDPVNARIVMEMKGNQHLWQDWLTIKKTLAPFLFLKRPRIQRSGDLFFFSDSVKI